MSETNNQSVQTQAQQTALLEQLAKPEVQESLSQLVEQLPKLTEVLNSLTAVHDFTKSLATDPVFKNDMISATVEIMGPAVDCAKTTALNAIEAKERAAKSTETFSVFSIMKMMKDPQVQKMFRFLNAYLQVSNERESKK